MAVDGGISIHSVRILMKEKVERKFSEAHLGFGEANKHFE